MPTTTQFIADSPEAERRLRDADGVVQRLLSFRRTYEPRWGELYRQLVSKPAKIKTYPDGEPRANIFAQFAFSNVNFVRNTLNEALFGLDPPMETLPAGARDEEASIKMQLVLEKLVLRDAKLRHVFNDYVAGLATYGFYALDIDWDWDVDFVYGWQVQTLRPDNTTPPQLIGQNPETGEPLVLDPMTGQPQLRRVQVLQPVPRNRPKFTALDIYDVAIDPDGAYIAKFFDKTLPQLERENRIAQAAGHELYNETALIKLRETVFSGGDNELTRNAILRLCQLWNATDGTCTLFTDSGDPTTLSFKDQRYAHRSANYTQFRRPIAQGAPKVLLSTGYNPYAHCRIPVLYSHYTRLPGETYGMGVIEPNYELNEKYNIALSLILDNWNVGVNQRYALNLMGNIETDDLRNANVPGGIVGIYGNLDGMIQELPTHTPDPGSYALLPIFQQLLERAANISDPYQRGIGAPTGNRTATGINAVIQQATRGMTQVALQLCEDILQPLFQLTASNIQQFLTDDVEVRITDEMPAIPKVNSNFLKISKADLAGHFDFRIVGAAYMENRFTAQNNARQLAQMFAGTPYLKLGSTIRELFRLHRISYPNRFIRTEEEVEMERQREMLMAYLQAIAATRANEADQAVGEQKEAQGARPASGGGATQPRRPMPTVDEITGAMRQFAQRMGANAQQPQAPGPPGQNAMGMGMPQ